VAEALEATGARNRRSEGEIDLRNELDGEVFESLKDLANFHQFSVDPDIQTIVWKNGADLAPEFLYEHLRIPA
jgi:hypothetical protein